YPCGRHPAKDGEILKTSRYTSAGPGAPGSVMTILFRLGSQEYVAFNGGPMFQFTEAISLVVKCTDQEEVDYYWERLTEGGAESQCGWLKDRFGVSWQVIPDALPEIFAGTDKEGVQRAMQAMLKMRKIDVAALQAAYKGVTVS
ncbi:MAG: VOC family protein, partial [Sphingobacteriales bacterium]